MTTSKGDRPKILVVEDEQVVALDLEHSLTGLGYEAVAVTPSGLKAVQLTEQFCPDLVLMDIQLPGTMDGIAAANQIRERWQIPVVFVTANANEETLNRAKATGAYGYLLKPFRPKELNATILMALQQHRLMRELFAEHTWLTTMLESLTDGVIATDAEGQVRYLNPAAEALTGWTQTEAFGQAIEVIYPQATLEGESVVQCQLRKALASAVPISKARFLLRTKQDQFVPIEDAAAPILEKGRTRGAVTVFRDITERLRRERQQEAERDRLGEQMQATSEALGQTRAELRALSGHLMTAQEEERRRIARELHDDFAQRTVMIEMQAERLAQRLSSADGETQQMLSHLRVQVVSLSHGLRETSHRLHPSTLEDLGLSVALRSLVTDLQERDHDVSLKVQDLVTPIPLETATALYRITQEALRNAAKHAANAPVHINLCERDGELQLTIEDAGPGFEGNQVRVKGGLGLLSMQERARLVSGTLLLRTAPGQGTSLSVRVPLTPER
jgi:PAS domain S-box-containing protein